jgi:hypothetical protein
MESGKLVFAQLMDFVPRHDFLAVASLCADLEDLGGIG